MKQRIIDHILSSSVYDVAKQTDVNYLDFLSSSLGNHIYLKREDQQPVYSFKLRGAYHKISLLSDSQLSAGVVAASAGNHAQGVAYSAMKKGVQATIVMPVTTPDIKVNAVRSFGATVILHGDSYDDAYEKAQVIIKESNAVFIHPYDDLDVIAGQGTIARELLEQVSNIDYMFIPVGGGGLLAGMAVYLKHINPAIKIIAVEPENSACLHEALQAKERVVLDHVGIFADGVAVKQIGQYPYDLVRDYVDDTVLLTTDEICAGVKDIYDSVRAIAEPAGALSLAGIKKYLQSHDIKGKTVAGILCGANINFHRLRHISERAELGEQKEALFSVAIDEKKGSFLTFCRVLKGRSITEFNYRYQHDNVAQIFVGIQLQDNETSADFLAVLNEQGYQAVDLTYNEVAKLHLRYMIGGKPQDLNNERLYRFQFPERPNALLNFLSTLGTDYNISLFHYRNHGAAYGRVLVGIQVSQDQLSGFTALLDSIGYTFFDETDNEGYPLFL
tara:strand:+ start:844 stop:2349 length:1506 start_codon:yes stop_codon:yes gene_type:complete